MHLDKPLLDWLQNYTFPLEDRFKDIEYAERTYPHVVKSTLSKGSTTAAYFGSIHKDACLVLADEAEIQGQRAFVGKTNMDTNTLADYYRSVYFMVFVLKTLFDTKIFSSSKIPSIYNPNMVG